MSRSTDGRERCPKCGHARAHPEECVHCGVVFAKLDRADGSQPAPERPVAVTGPPGEARSGSERGGGRRPGFLLVVLALAVAMLAVAEVDRDRRARAELELASIAPVAPAVEPASVSKAPPAARRPRTPSPRGSGSGPPAGSPTPPRSASAGPGDRPDSARAVSASHDWYRGADGFLRGMQEAQGEKKAVLVYFYTDWCGYCRRLDRDLLSRVAVSGTTRYFVKIKVNPEDGRAERLLANRYGISGYPSLYVHGAGSPRATKIRTTTQGRLKRPSEFTAALTHAAGETFTSG